MERLAEGLVSAPKELREWLFIAAPAQTDG
jgi:hypothetical protein